MYQIATNGNSFVIDGDSGVTLVDTGMPGSRRKVVAGLASIGRSPGDLVAIVVTHGHSDHFGVASRLKRESGARVVASELDAPILQRELPIPPPPFLGRLGFLASLFPSPDAVIVDHRIAPGGPTTVPDLTVIDTPGHTPGHISLLLDRSGGVVFVGDAAVADRSGVVGRGFMNRPSTVFDDSLRRLADSDFEIACFGHARPIVGGASAAFRQFVGAI